MQSENRDEYSKPEVEYIPNEKESLESLLGGVNDYIDSFDTIYAEMEKTTTDDKEYLGQLASDQEISDKELPFFQSVYEKLLENEKTKRNFLQAIDLKSHITESITKLGKNGEVIELPATKLKRQLEELREEKRSLEEKESLTPEDQENLRSIRDRINEIALTLSGAEKPDNPPSDESTPPNDAA